MQPDIYTVRWLADRQKQSEIRISRLESQEASGVTTFTGLSDTPSSIGTADALKILRVDSGGSAVEFGTVTYSDLPVAGTATLGVAVFDNNYFTVTNGTVVFSGTPGPHAASHQSGGVDQIGTATPTADAIPYADGSGKLDSWISTAGTATLGRAAFASSSILTVSNGTVTFNQGNVDHGSIAGLGDDDHTQYLLTNGNRQLTGSWDAGDYAVYVKELRQRLNAALNFYANGGFAFINSGGTVALAVADGGSVAIGHSSPEAPLHVSGISGQASVLLNNGEWLGGKNAGGTVVRVFGVSASNHVYLGAVDDAGGDVILREDGSDIITITGGDVGIADSTPSYKLDVTGDINATGEVRNSGVALTSDPRLKEDMTPLSDILAKLALVRGYSFKWGDKARQIHPKLRDGLQHGLDADEIEQVFPDLVSTWNVRVGERITEEIDADGTAVKRVTPIKEDIKCVDYSRMVPILLEAVRELAARFDQISAK